MKRFRLLFLVLFAIFTGGLGAQTLINFSLVGGSDKSFSITQIRKMEFTVTSILIAQAEETPLGLLYTNVQRITFTPSPTNQVVEKKEEVSFRYDRRNSMLTIDNIDPQVVSLYNITGQLAHKGFYSSSDAINLGSLPDGIYLVKLQHQTLKFVKR